MREQVINSLKRAFQSARVAGIHPTGIPSVDYDYSDYSTVTYVSVIVLTGICKRRKQATDCSRLGHRGPRVHAARACRFFGIPSVVY